MRISKEIYSRLVNNSINAKQSKYKNTKIYLDGHWFDSKKESNRYIELKKLEKFGVIKNLRIQVPFLLLDAFTVNGISYRKIVYYADFTYEKDGKLMVEDVKSEATRKDKVYRIKIKMLLNRYRDIEFKEIL